VIAVIAFYTSQNSKPSTSSNEAVVPTQAASNEASSAKYENGTYTVTGNYVSPGGPRDIGVTVVIVNDVITDATFEGRATDPTSKRFQGEFGDNFKPMVVGKNIDEVVLTKVSGSSLTPKGFNDAVQKIKSEAAQS
jgi:uncharacterized protein with FMN-binding domain